MARNKNARQVKYFVKRERKGEQTLYWVHAGNHMYLIEKKEYGWFGGSCYHQTLRDAIIYVLYGV